MTKFDSFIQKLMEEGLGNMGPKVGGGAPATAGSGGLNSPAAKPAMGSAPGAAPGGQLNIQNVIDDKTTQWKDWLEKPYNSEALNAHVMATMFDPKADPAQRDNLTKTIDGNPDLKNYYTNLVNTMQSPQS